MATKKSTESPTEKGQNENLKYESPRTRKKLKTQVEEEDDDQSNYMSLDVLAQVASETLQSEPTGKRNAKKMMRMLQSLEVLNLKQIQSLSDKFLVNFFAEMSSNEMTRNFVYTCILMPGKCQAQFRSFGNESGARMKMRNHLHKHIEQLVDEENDPKLEEKFQFAAEPVHMKNRRLTEMSSTTRRNKVLPNKKLRFTALKASKYDNISNSMDDMSDVKSSEVTDESRDSMDQMSGDENDSTLNNNDTNTKKARPAQSCRDPKSGTKENKGRNGSQFVDTSKYSLEETERRLEENEQFIIDLLSRTQPHHDHSYTTIFGKKKSFHTLEFLGASDDENFEEEDDDNVQFYCGREIIRPKRIAEPILCLGNVSVMDELSGYGHDEASKTIIVCAEEIVGDRTESPSLLEEPKNRRGHNGQRPYPPMPKCPIARHGRIAIPEEYESPTEEEKLQRSPMAGIGTPKKKRKNPNELAPTEWERKAALKCIRELKARKRDLMYPLFCKICTNKQFTAAATLMYHYRSHAGIKPFVCLICNTTFTRQHSLNYHMLIHNNQSRFTCKDCGRKFRHPSHFKEHLRRHTGETPFICADCPQKFKTRNTYKRHLKTRHGKLLTASGIKILTVEEFAKIRTKPYRRTPDKEVRKMVSDIKSKLDAVDQDMNESDVDITDEEDRSVEDNTSIKEENEETDENCLSDGNTLFIPLGITVNS